MKKIVLLVIIIGFCSCNNSDDNETASMSFDFLGELDWVQSFGGSGEDTAQSIIQTSDGGYAVLGFTNSTDGDLAGKSLNVNDYWLLKFDVDGNLQWNKTYGGSKDDRGQSVIQTNDGGYAIVGYAMSDDGDGSNNEGFHDNWILRLDASGTILWEKSFGFSGHDHSYDVVQTSDGGFFFSGFLDVTSSEGEGNTGKSPYLTRHGVGEFWGTRLDANGDLIWRRYFGGTNNDRSFGVVEANDGGLVMVGASESDDFDISNSKGSYDFWVVKVSAKGEMLWEKSFGGTGIDKAYAVVKTQDNAYAVVGNTFSVDTDISKNNGESDVWLIKVSDSGDLLWEKTFGGTAFDAARGLGTTADGGFVIAGNSKSLDGNATQNNGENDLWIIKTDAEGNVLFEKSFGGADLDFGFDALEDAEGNLVLVGESSTALSPNKEHQGSTDLVILRIK
ncbi:hypothetical protein ACOKFD_13025 [Flagellimonas sp. S174]|uniref:hypothetical protein n=1 Tax=Flagellimonas sp. S174 TaxID=3410790 RepID=UPI003BF61269